MVGGVDGDLVDVELFCADEFDGREADEEQDAGPELGDEVLLAAGFVPQAADEGDAAEEGGGESYQRDQKEIGEPAEEAGLVGCWFG